MEILAKLYQSTKKINYFVDGVMVFKKDKTYTYLDGTPVKNSELVKGLPVYTESWCFPIKASVENSEIELHDIADYIAETLIFASETAYVDGKKFTKFSLNKTINITVSIDGCYAFDTSDLLTHINTFRMTYTKKGEKGTFTREQLTRGIAAIFATASRMNTTKEL